MPETRFDCLAADAKFLRGQHKEAFEEYFRGATEYHDGRAAFNVGFLYQKGYGVPRNDRMARRFYEAATWLDGGEASFNLALLYLRGRGGPVDLAAAKRAMEQAAADGCIDAQNYLGVAYTIGCLFDPLDIDCLSLIPFHRVIRREIPQRFLGGAGLDPDLEAQRFAILEADEVRAVELFEQAASHEDDTYLEEQIGQARFLLGQSLIEGFGMDYSPARGYRLLEDAALHYASREAAAYLDTNREAALVYGVDARRVQHLLEEK